jgi:hypothetical protein
VGAAKLLMTMTFATGDFCAKTALVMTASGSSPKPEDAGLKPL